MLLAIVDVVDDLTVLEQDDALADIDGMLQVVTAHEDGCARLLVVLLQQMLDGILAAGVEEVERLVEDEHFGPQQHGRHDAHLLLVARAERADELLLSGQLVGHEVLILCKKRLQLLVARVCEAGDELEVLVGRKVVDKEAFVNECARPILPDFSLSHVDKTRGKGQGARGKRIVGAGRILMLLAPCSLPHVYRSRVGLDEVEDEAEERTLAGTIVAYQSQQLAAVDGQFGYINGNLLAECLLEVFYNDVHISIIFFTFLPFQLCLEARKPSMFLYRRAMKRV